MDDNIVKSLQLGFPFFFLFMILTMKNLRQIMIKKVRQVL